MDKFTNKIGKIDSRRYTDKTKNDIYNMIKEHLSVRIDGNEEYVDSDLSINGLEELTDVLYNYVQQEKTKQDIATLERVKLHISIGTLNLKSINEYIEDTKLYLIKEGVDPNQDKKTVKISKCSDDRRWYKNYINQKFVVIDDNSKWDDGKERFKVVQNDIIKGGVFYIDKEDAEILK
jgi:hypothetical protein